MKNALKWIIISLVLIIVLVSATYFYNKLSKEYANDNLMENPAQNSGDDEQENKPDLTAPDFEVLDKDSNTVRLSDFKGKPVVLNFWATWCYYCKQEMPDFDTAFKKYPDVQFMMVNATDGVQETMEIAKEYVKEQGFSFDVFYDTKLSAVRNYGVSGFPMTFFIDKDGNFVTYASGMISLELLEKGISMISDAE